MADSASNSMLALQSNAEWSHHWALLAEDRRPPKPTPPPSANFWSSPKPAERLRRKTAASSTASHSESAIHRPQNWCDAAAEVRKSADGSVDAEKTPAQAIRPSPGRREKKWTRNRTKWKRKKCWKNDRHPMYLQSYHQHHLHRTQWTHWTYSACWHSQLRP